MFNLLIDDWIKFQSYDNDFDPVEANSQFIRVYNAIPDRDVSSGGGMLLRLFCAGISLACAGPVSVRFAAGCAAGCISTVRENSQSMWCSLAS